MSCLPNGLLNGTDYHYLARNTRTVPLTDDLFDNDSHCMLNLRSKTLAIVEKDTGRAVRCNIEGVSLCADLVQAGKALPLCLH